MESAMAALQKYRIFNVKETGREFGRGSYGAVIEVDYKGLICAAKKMHTVLYKQGVGDLVHRFVEECKLLSELQHPRIVQFVGVWFESEKSHVPVLVMEFLPNNLAQCVECHGRLPEEIAYSILQDVALGLRYLHERPKPIIHRDLSANNVLLTGDMRAKISDLGGAKILDLNPKRMTMGPGTLSYMPPETMAHNPRYNSKVDIFSYGVMMVHVFSGQWPEPSESVIPNDKGNLIAVSEAGRRQKYLNDIGHGHPLMELILQCLQNQPCHRPVIVEVFRQVSDEASQFRPTFSDKIEAIKRMKFEAAEKAKMQRIITEKNMEIRQFQNELQTRERMIAALQKELETRYQTAPNHQVSTTIENQVGSLPTPVPITTMQRKPHPMAMPRHTTTESHQEPTPNPIKYYDILLLGKTGIGKSTTGYKMLELTKNSSDQCSPDIKQFVSVIPGLLRSTEDKQKHFMQADDLTEEYSAVTSQCKVLSSEKVIPLNGVSMKLRILDVPGFTHFGTPRKSDGIYEGNLKILHWIVRVQAELGMNFRRIVYFLPCRGPLEKADKVLQNELKLMYQYFRKSIFECMVLAGTNLPSMKYQTSGMEFDPEEIVQTQVIVQEAMRMATGDRNLCCPPLVYIGLSPQYTCSRIISDILLAPVQCDEGLQLTICETEDFRQH